MIILLALLHLNVKNIRIGPKAPAFLTQEALDVSWCWRAAGRPAGVVVGSALTGSRLACLPLFFPCCFQ